MVVYFYIIYIINPNYTHVEEVFPNDQIAACNQLRMQKENPSQK